MHLDDLCFVLSEQENLQQLLLYLLALFYLFMLNPHLHDWGSDFNFI